MGYLSDSLDFEKFFVKDLWKGVKKDPKRLVLGVDPASTWGWNKILGRDDKPLVDQMGGPYDGRVFSYGHGDGGVYDRATAAGINTTSAQKNHDAAHLIAGSYALAGGLGSAGNAGGSGNANPQLWDNVFKGSQGFGGAPYGANPAAGIGGIAGPVGGGTGASSAAGLGAGDYAKLGMQALQAMPQQQQQQAPPPARPPMAQPNPNQNLSIGQRLQGGLGRVGQTLFPTDPSMPPDQANALRQSAIMQLGLGMMGASSKGAGFGAALNSGYGQASNNMQGAMQRAYENAAKSRDETRADKREVREGEREDRLDARQQWLEDHTLEREKTGDERYNTAQDFQLKQADQAQKRWEAEQKAQSQWRQDQLAARSNEEPSLKPGFRWANPEHTEQEFIKGGPADPAVAAGNLNLRPIPATAAKGIIENRTSIKQLDRALAAVDTDPTTNPKGAAGAAAANTDAFGMQNYAPDALTQRLPGKSLSGGLEARAQVADIGSLIIHDRSGAAVTVSEFPRLKPFIPVATDDPATVKKKLTNLKANLELMQDEIEGFYTPESGYRPLSPSDKQAGPPGAGLGQAARQPAPSSAVQYLRAHPEVADQFRAKYGYLP